MVLSWTECHKVCEKSLDYICMQKCRCVVRAADGRSIGVSSDDGGQGAGAWLQAKGIPT